MAHLIAIVLRRVATERLCVRVCLCIYSARISHASCRFWGFSQRGSFWSIEFFNWSAIIENWNWKKKTKQNKSDSLATTQVVAANSLPIYGAVVRAAVEVEVERSQQSEWSDHMAPQTNFKANLLPFASCVLLSNCSICAAWLLLCWHIKAIV